MKQADIDGVLRAYSRKPSSREHHATIMKVGRWRVGEGASSWVRLRRIDTYLKHDPFGWRDCRVPHPWQRLENEAMFGARAKIFYTPMGSAKA